MKVLATFALMIAACLAPCTAAAAGGQREAPICASRMARVHGDLVHLRGVVQKITANAEDATLCPGDIGIQLGTPDAVVMVILGPQPFVRNVDELLPHNQFVELKGVALRFGGHDVIFASEVTTPNGAIVTLRADDGRALWTSEAARRALCGLDQSEFGATGMRGEAEEDADAYVTCARQMSRMRDTH